MNYKNRTDRIISVEVGINARRFTQWVVVEPGDEVDTDNLRGRYDEDGITLYEDIDERMESAGLVSQAGSTELSDMTIRQLLGIAEEDGIEITSRRKDDIIREITEAREEMEAE